MSNHAKQRPNAVPTMLRRLMNFRSVYGQLKGELAKIIIGQEQVIEHLAICLFSRGARPVDGRARTGEDAVNQPVCREDGVAVQPHPVHAPT